MTRGYTAALLKLFRQGVSPAEAAKIVGCLPSYAVAVWEKDKTLSAVYSKPRRIKPDPQVRAELIRRCREPVRLLAKEFGVSQDYIYDIRGRYGLRRLQPQVSSGSGEAVQNPGAPSS